MTKIKTVWEVIHFSWSTVWLSGVDLNTFWKKKKKKGFSNYATHKYCYLIFVSRVQVAFRI